jgi:transcriptional regulator
MYVPASFAETDLTTLHNFVEQNSFGLLVSQVDGQSFASHLPFLLDRESAPNGALVGHMARANPQWREAQGQTALVVFPGPHVYVSPTWYETEQVVPTWNYVAVHAYGPIHVIEDPPALLNIVERSVEIYEHAMPQPWRFDSSTTFAKRMLSRIVGFRIEIERIEGKWKLNQNHPVERRKKVVRALRQRDGENSRAVAELMQESLGAEGEL